MDPENQECENCKKVFPVDRIDLHEAYCSGNIRKCKNCDKMIDIKEQEQHDVPSFLVRKSSMTKNNAASATKWLNQSTSLDMRRFARGSRWHASSVRILGRRSNFPSTLNRVGQGPSPASSATRTSCWRTSKSIVENASGEGRKELRSLRTKWGTEETEESIVATVKEKGKTALTIWEINQSNRTRSTRSSSLTSSSPATSSVQREFGQQSILSLFLWESPSRTRSSSQDLHSRAKTDQFVPDYDAIESSIQKPICSSNISLPSFPFPKLLNYSAIAWLFIKTNHG